MILSRFLVTVEIPDSFITQRQEKALETLDHQIDLPKVIQTAAQQKLWETKNLMEAKVTVTL